ncbi:MAG: sarcosine oxidase subunit gamma [Paracoccaceae bacterium]
MSDPVSPLAGVSFGGLIRITETGPRGMLTVRGDLTSAKLAKAVKTATGCAMPAPMGTVTDGDRGVCWMSPDELLVLVPHADATGAEQAMTAALAGEHALVVDVSDARVCFSLEGEAALIRETLAKLIPADTRPKALPVGTMRRTRLAQVPAAVFFTGETRAELICFRSVADYAFGLLCHAAKPGSAVGHFAR